MIASGARWPARLAVLVAHAGLLAALWLHRPALWTPATDRVVATLRLMPLQPLQTATATKRPAPTAPRQRAAPQPAPAAPAPTSATPALTPLTPLTPLSPPGPATTAPVVPPATSATAPPRSTLRLSLPAPMAAASSPRNPALDDPRAHTPRLTLEDRIADATGGAGAWVEERTSDNRSQAVGALGDRRTVMRRGDTCVEISRSRIADQDRFNESVAPRTVSMLGKPYKCR